MFVSVAALLAATCEFAHIAAAAELRIQIPSSALLANPNTLPASTHATLTSGSEPPLNAVLRKDNTIVFSDVSTTGSHLLKIYTRDYAFAPYRIDIIAAAGSNAPTTQISAVAETYLGTKWSDQGLALLNSPTPLSSYTLYPKVLSRKNFYEDRAGFSAASLLKNPMLLLGVVALAATLGIPKLIENMDPEMKAEYEEMQKKGPMASLSQAMTGQLPATGSGVSSGGGGGSGKTAPSFDLAGYLASAQTSGSKTSAREAGGDVRERKK